MDITAIILIAISLLLLFVSDSWLKSVLADEKQQSLYKVTRIPFGSYDWAFKNLNKTIIPLAIQAIALLIFISGIIL